MKYLSTQKKDERGFTILESIISIFILLAAITGPLVYITSGFKAARQAKYQMIAYYLAAETIEQVKFYRDDNVADPLWYRLGKPSSFTSLTSSNSFDWDQSSGDFHGCNPGGGGGDQWRCSRLSIDANGKYGYGAGDISVFTREVIEYINAPGNDDEYILTVRVGWDDERVNGLIDITEHIFDIHN